MQHFDLCVIGAGSGNSVVTRHFADQKVALIDAGEHFGGTCLNAGCIPTKMFLHPADLATDARHAPALGVTTGAVSADWAAVRDRIFARIDPISASGEDYRERQDGVTLFRSAAHFVGPKLLQVGGEQISATSFVLAAGSRPRIPDVEGIDEPELADRVHTSQTIMRLAQVPRRLVIVGGGSIAVEFAHLFASFGSEVTLLVRGDRLLRKVDAEISDRFTRLVSDEVTLRLGQRLTGLEPVGAGVSAATVDVDGIEYDFEADQVLLALGRVPNGDSLNLAATGVDLDCDGYVVTDEFQRTTSAGIWALGDICDRHQLKHVANHQARVVQHNLLHPDDLISGRREVVPQAVFGRPQVAFVGLTEEELLASGQPYVTSAREYSSVAYGWAMEDTDHVAKVLAEPGTGRILGAHIMGPQAATLIQPIVQAMSLGQDARTLARDQYWIHPALSEVVENALLDLPL